ncbi:MAG: gamma-glutamyltransferase [Myxococcota bacterium]|nr:gamma-glutamyltransferase [Myxococcota bacterium]
MDRVTGSYFSSRSEVFAQNAMAATSQPLATQVALHIIKSGGNAIDAAIAANAILGLVEPTGAGIGGDLFVLFWSAREHGLIGLNASGRSPKSLTLEKLLEYKIDYLPAHGPLPVSVPGCVDGWVKLHERYGQLPFSELFKPAISYARKGFPVSEVIAHEIALNAEILKGYAGFGDVFLDHGKTPSKGTLFKNPGLADAYSLMAEEGRRGFYEGPIAQTIDDYMQTQGGYLRKTDLAEHRSHWVQPVGANYRGYTLWELPPNGQGIAAQQMLKMLEHFDIRAMGQVSSDYVHHVVEAKKLAFEDRAKFYADPDFNKIPVRHLISDEYNQARATLISPSEAALSIEPGNPNLDQGDTVYLTTADAEGNMVSLIQSNYRGMGSGMTIPGFGFVLQDRGQLFDLTPGRFNTYEPGKRPFHTIIPAFVTKDRQPWLSFGVMGGATQPQMHAQILMNLLDFGMNLQEAGDAPRIVHIGSSQPTGEVMTDGGMVCLESGFPEQVREDLARRGHQLSDQTGVFGGYQAISRDLNTGIYCGASESRKDGAAMGY